MLSLYGPEEVERALGLGPHLENPLSFREYVCLVKPSYKWYRHCEINAAVLQRVADDELKRVMIFEPPRHGKSEQVSRLFPAYYLYRHPERWVGINSYGASLAYKLSRAARENFVRGGGRIKDDANTIEQWDTVQGGGLWAAGVGGPITGKGYHLGIIDDPLKNAEEAASETIREGHKEWYESTFFTREEPDGAQIIVQTRWNEDDLAGWLLATEEETAIEAADNPELEITCERWHILNFEAIKTDEQIEVPDTCTVEPDWREVGEALCPERYPIARLMKIARRIRSYWWNALYQQRPSPLEGKIFKGDWFKGYYKRLPPLLEVWTTWDTALKAKEENDETACVTAGKCANGYLYILRVVHGHWETPAVSDFLVKQSKWLRGLYGDRYKGDYIEDKVSGTTLMQYVRKSNPEVTVIPVPVEADKVARAHGITPMCEAGQVLLPDPVIYPAVQSGIGALLHQLMIFPGSKRDDIVDAFVYSLKKFLGTIGRRKSRRSKAGGVV